MDVAHLRPPAIFAEFGRHAMLRRPQSGNLANAAPVNEAPLCGRLDTRRWSPRAQIGQGPGSLLREKAQTRCLRTRRRLAADPAAARTHRFNTISNMHLTPCAWQTRVLSQRSR